MLQELYVYLYLKGEGWVPCGFIEYEERGRLSESRFRYGTKYLQRFHAIAIDPAHLPLTNQTFVTADGFALFNGIRDAGPDKWGRYLLDKKFGRPLNELEYVAATGLDRVGALAFSDNPQSGPKIYTPDGFIAPNEKQLDIALSAGAVQDIQAEEDTERLRQYLQYGPSLGGARPKANVTWHGELYLAKFSLTRDGRNEPLIEYATMTLAAKCGLQVPPVERTEVLGRAVYLTKRFDRKGSIPIPFISGLTITGLHESDYPMWSYHLLVDAIAKHSSNPARDLKELFMRMVFNIVVYNNDDHPRNFGFIHAEQDRWDLSPLYDIVPTSVHTQTFALAMIVGEEGKKASLKNALSQSNRFRLSLVEAKKIIKRIEEEVSNWQKHFREHGVETRDIEALENSFSQKP